MRSGKGKTHTNQEFPLNKNKVHPVKFRTVREIVIELAILKFLQLVDAEKYFAKIIAHTLRM